MAVERKRERVHLAFDVVGSTASGGKPPIILLHGMTSAKEGWQNVIHPIAEATRRKVYAYDARNHGDSGWSETFDYDNMKEDLLQFMDCIHAEKAILIGHSMGGKTAMFFATNYPERVEKLIVEDISPKPGAQHVRNEVLKYMQMLQDAIKRIPSDVKDLQEAKYFVYNFLHNNKSQDDPSRSRNKCSSLPLYQDESGHFKWKTNLEVLERHLLQPHQPSNVTGLFPGPTLMLYGTRSPYKVSADRDFIKRLFPSSELRAIEGANHQIHEEHGDVFVKEVVDFIRES